MSNGLAGLELVRIRLPLVEPWVTAAGTTAEREVLLVRVEFDGAEGWGECVAQGEPTYTSEYVDAAADVLTRYLVPRLVAAGVANAASVGPALSGIKGHPMAKAALEAAVLDAELRARGVSLADHLSGLSAVRRSDPVKRAEASRGPATPEPGEWTVGPRERGERMVGPRERGERMVGPRERELMVGPGEGVAPGRYLPNRRRTTPGAEARAKALMRVGGVSGHGPRRVVGGVAVGLAGSVPALVEEVARRVEEGYRRVKLKVHPGWDVEPVHALRQAFPDLALQVDGNAAYAGLAAGEARRALAALDRFELLLIEQPLGDDDLLGHAALAAAIATPVCLDEAITSLAVTETALALGACGVVNIKAGRVGGYLEAVRIHDTCAASGVPVWCGGMLETGIGRAANLALATLPNFSLPGDISGSDRFWVSDIVTQPARLEPDGTVVVPSGPGTGVEVVDLSAWIVARRRLW